jgi:hypothetical protein
MSALQANERFIGMQSIEEHGEYYDDAGEWLPLAVWGTRGFDMEAIQEKSRPQDRRSHAVLGEIFRVAILKSGHRGHKSASKTDTLKASLEASSSGGPPPVQSGGPSPVLAIGDKAAESSSSDESSSSSSASRKRSKKSKRSKKESKKESKKVKKEKKEKKDKELKRKREAEEAKASVSSTSSFGDPRVLLSLSDRVAEYSRMVCDIVTSSIQRPCRYNYVATTSLKKVRPHIEQPYRCMIVQI